MVSINGVLEKRGKIVNNMAYDVFGNDFFNQYYNRLKSVDDDYNKNVTTREHELHMKLNVVNEENNKLRETNADLIKKMIDLKQRNVELRINYNKIKEKYDTRQKFIDIKNNISKFFNKCLKDFIYWINN